MKKIVTLILMLCMVLSFTACADKESKTPEITLQDIYVRFVFLTFMPD